MCECGHDFTKDQHLYTLESPFIHSATDISQRSGPDSPSLKAKERVAQLYTVSLSKGIQHNMKQPNGYSSKRNYCPDRGSSKVTEWNLSECGIHVHLDGVIYSFQ